MTNIQTSDDHISNTENPLPENVRNLISARMFREITEKDEKEKEKRE